MRDYELVLVVSPDGGEEGFPATVDRVHGFITERGGEVKNEDRWGRRRLAYPVNRFTEGYYNISQFTIDPQHIRDLENSLDLAEDVLRHLVVRLEEPIVVQPPASEEPAGEAEPPSEETSEESTEEPAVPTGRQVEAAAES